MPPRGFFFLFWGGGGRHVTSVTSGKARFSPALGTEPTTSLVRRSSQMSGDRPVRSEHVRRKRKKNSSLLRKREKPSFSHLASARSLHGGASIVVVFLPFAPFAPLGGRIERNGVAGEVRLRRLEWVGGGEEILPTLRHVLGIPRHIHMYIGGTSGKVNVGR
ncbi:hypothetical protein F4809DRAFT_461080 [Biscogniauxia mediterranea]|nr:hypothetical protein F4809DRAFT_461080 [Biscogniauxia mediterranea]